MGKAQAAVSASIPKNLFLQGRGEMSSNDQAHLQTPAYPQGEAILGQPLSWPLTTMESFLLKYL